MRTTLQAPARLLVRYPAEIAGPWLLLLGALLGLVGCAERRPAGAEAPSLDLGSVAPDLGSSATPDLNRDAGTSPVELGEPGPDQQGVAEDAAAAVDQSSTDAATPGTDTCAAEPEQCDGRDNDCDGLTDEGLSLGSCATVCGVGKLRCQEGSLACEGPQPEPEACDGLDNDCNGGVDDGLPHCCWPPGSSRACGLATGACEEGQQRCQGADGWGPCTGAIEPMPERCNGEDDDCNGVVDDVAAAGSPCGRAVGLCQPGVLRCFNGVEVCEGEVGPQPEVCDGLDNDCDGGVDEGNPGGGAGCGVERGICRPGVLICLDGLLRCLGEVTPQVERCNGEDDDCDGEVDEAVAEVGGACPTGRLGVCASGQVVCRDGNLRCEPAHEPTPEVCNNQDDDCNGLVDEGTDQGAPCRVGQGACQREGELQCFADGRPSVCDAVAGPPGPELCGSGQDEDCDSETDEGFPVGEICEAGQGSCRRAGYLECTLDGRGVQCTAQPAAPGAELCGTGVDEDCDGEVDEGFVLGQVCAAGEGACRRPGLTVCSPDRTTVACGVEPGVPGVELCGTGVDEDCDGETDEGFQFGQRCLVGEGLCRAEGKTICGPDGQVACTGVPGVPEPERCGTQVDEDCDGETDEDFGVGEPCAAGMGGCARDGRLRCRADGLAAECDAAPGAPIPELCGNGVDDDCNGQTDEGFPVGQACTVGLGECRRDGRLICSGDGTTTRRSVQAGLPGPEQCDELDNDCDGATDEDAGCDEQCGPAIGDARCLAQGQFCEPWTYDGGALHCSTLCDSQADCEAGLVCTLHLTYNTTGFGLCVAPAPGATQVAGDPCQQDGDCLTDHCLDGFCRELCSSDGWANPAHHVCPAGEVCSVWLIGPRRAGGFCLPAQPQLGAVGARCGWAGDCQSGLCDPIFGYCLPPCQTHYDCNAPDTNWNYCGILTDPNSGEPVVLGCFANFYLQELGWGATRENLGAPCSVQAEHDCFRGWCFHYTGWRIPDRCSDVCTEDADCGIGYQCKPAILQRPPFPETLVRVCDHPEW